MKRYTKDEVKKMLQIHVLTVKTCNPVVYQKKLYNIVILVDQNIDNIFLF